MTLSKHGNTRRDADAVWRKMNDARNAKIKAEQEERDCAADLEKLIRQLKPDPSCYHTSSTWLPSGLKYCNWCYCEDKDID